MTASACRLCGEKLHRSFVDLGVTPLANAYLTPEQAARGEDRAYPLHAWVCDTCLLVLKPEEGRSLAKTLGPNWIVLMRRHGVTVAAKTLQNLVFRCIYSYRNAELQLMAERQGEISPLTPGERKMAMDRNNEPRPQARASMGRVAGAVF